MTDTARPGAQSPDDSPVSGLVDRAQTLASNAASSAQDKVRSLAEEQKNAAAEQVERVLPEAGHYVRDAAGGVRRVSSAVREKSVDDIVEMGLDFARSRPGTFLAGSVLVGFALARFLKSSADRRAERSPGGHAAKGRQAGGAKKSSSGRAGGRSAGAAAGGSTGNADASATAGV